MPMTMFNSNITEDKRIYIIGPREVVGSCTESAVLFRILFVLLLRAGFVLVQIGSIPTEDVPRILLQNILDIAISLVSYGFIGFQLNFGSNSLEGIVGYGAWIDSGIKDVSLHQAGYGFAAVLVGTGIITTMFCTRLHLLAVAIISFFYSAILYPVVAHWLWAEHGWMQQVKTTINDYAGGLAVHTTASTFAAVGAIFLGRRLLRLSDISEISVIGTEISKNTVAGYIFVLIGLIVFSLPTPEEEYRLQYKKFDGLLFTNSVLSLSAAGLITILLDLIFTCKNKITYWALLKYLQAAIAGVVALSCGLHTFSPIASFFVGLTAGALFFIFAALVHLSFIEDNCNIIASSFICSFLASFASQLIHKSETRFGAIHSENFTWQLTCYFIIFTVSFISAILIFLLLYVSGRLKSKSENVNHKRAIVAYRSKKRTSVMKLFAVAKNARYVEPGTAKAGEEDVVVGTSIKQEASEVTDIDTTLSKESSVTKIWSSQEDPDRNRKKPKKYLNLQESATQIKRSR